MDILFSKVKYDKKNNTFSVEVLDFAFIGRYGKNTVVKKILDDIFAALSRANIVRDKLRFLDANSNPISEMAKLKDLIVPSKKVKEVPKVVKEPKQLEEKGEAKKDHDKAPEAAIETQKLEDQLKADQLKDRLTYVEKKMTADREESKIPFGEAVAKQAKAIEQEREERIKPPLPPPPRSAPPAPISAMGDPNRVPPSRYSTLPPPPGAAPPPPGAGAPPSAESIRVRSEMLSELDKLKSLMSKEGAALSDAPTRYDINMGLQYYPVIMEQNRYLFYVYFSHEELKIEDEEGKTVYQTTITITTTKPTPPILNLRVQGENFEVHPLSGNIEVKKDAINPPIMIFSVLALKSTENKSKKERKEGETRFLHVYVDFENKTVSHTVLSILVQPKFFKLKLGPINMNLSKTQAIMISIASILITVISTVYTLMSMDLTSTSSGSGTLEGLIPGAGSLIFLGTFLVTLLRKGIFPIKSKVAGLLDLNKSIMLK